MSTYTVTDTPSEIVLGANSSDTALINRGPSTLFLGADTSVSPLNGMPLAPMGQAKWNAKQQLYAVCRSSKSATLSAHLSSGQIDASRSKFNTILANASLNRVQSFNTPIIEVGHCESLMFEIIETNLSDTTPEIHFVEVNWFDDNDNPIDSQTYYPLNLAMAGLGGQPFNFVHIHIPVMAVGVQFQVFATQPNTFLLGWTIWGTNRALPPKMYSGAYQAGVQYSMQAVNNTSSLFAYAQSDDWVSFNIQTYTQNTLIANLGTTCDIGISAQGITTGADVFFGPFTISPVNAPGNGQRWLNITIPTTASRFHFSNVNWPKTMPLEFNSQSLVGGNISVHIAWKDNTP